MVVPKTVREDWVIHPPTATTCGAASLSVALAVLYFGISCLCSSHSSMHISYHPILPVVQANCGIEAWNME